MKVNVLGTDYTILRKIEAEDPKLKKNDGYCDSSTKTIVILIYQEDVMNKENMEAFGKQVLRHEITHAFLNESGLDNCSSVNEEPWARNEEMVDWIAIQSPKIFKAFQEAGCL